ncbi:hypothetical protein AVEN_174371-1 [Araneus ventricosus]|uniref:Peptidase aspartic putative domain-containing protein n=1 Tax=Araneus ventricosus TaxID=182803 RepID=A0A4Y2VDR6_ARAVE|nr:hypothetical protein AVEN_174371-1 [Araneus ventricosus]
MGYIPVRKGTLLHSLFGGVKSQKFEHTCYKIRLRSTENNFACNFEALDQLTICNDVTPVNAGPWMKKLQEMNITLTHVGEKSQPVKVLIGADLFVKFLTGQSRVFYHVDWWPLRLRMGEFCLERFLRTEILQVMSC